MICMGPALPPCHRWVNWGIEDKLDTPGSWRGGVAEWKRCDVVLDLAWIPALLLPIFVLLAEKSFNLSEPLFPHL